MQRKTLAQQLVELFSFKITLLEEYNHIHSSLSTIIALHERKDWHGVMINLKSLQSYYAKEVVILDAAVKMDLT